MENSKIYFVYLYYWPTLNKWYIGKTYKGSERCGKLSGYKGQYVYRYMEKYPFEVYELATSYNPIIIGYIESELIREVINCLNVSIETLQSELKHCITNYYKSINILSFEADLKEFWNKKKVADEEIRKIYKQYPFLKED